MPFTQPFGQQPPGMWPGLENTKANIHPLTKYVLGAVGTVGGYFVGLNQDFVPVALCVGVGLVAGLLLVDLLFHGIGFLAGALIVAVAAMAMYWLLNNDAALKHRQTAPVQHAAPADRSHGWLAELPGVQL